MLDYRSLQGRLTLAYAGALLLTLFVFAVVALAILTQSQRTELDARLSGITGTIASLDVWHDGAFHGQSIDAKWIAKLNGTAAESSIFAPDGSVLFTTTPAIPDAVRRAAMDSRSSLRTGEVGSPPDPWLVRVDPIARGGKTLGVSVAWHDLLPDRGLENRIFMTSLLAIPVLALVSVVLGAVAARAGLRPLRAMVNVVSDIGARDLSRRVGPAEMPREVARLAYAFNRMLDRLEAAFIRERQFTADASHELRAPLSVIRATAEHALEKYRDEPEYRRALRSIEFETNDLELIVRDLLSAARADSTAPKPGANAELAAVIFDVAEELYPLTRARSITLRREVEGEVLVELSPPAVARIVRALLDNALRHACDEGEVCVAVEISKREALLVVRDDGAGFSKEALEHATERFWRDDRSRARGEGTGLGLAIVEGIARAAGGRIELRNGAAGGAVVTVTLPLAS